MTAHLEVFRQLCAGHVWDGNLASKDARDALVKAGFVCRVSGFNLLTAEGVRVAAALDLIVSAQSSAPKNEEPIETLRARLRPVGFPVASSEGGYVTFYNDQKVPVSLHEHRALKIGDTIRLHMCNAVLIDKGGNLPGGELWMRFAFFDARDEEARTRFSFHDVFPPE